MKLSTVSDYLVVRGIVIDSLKQIGVVPNTKLAPGPRIPTGYGTATLVFVVETLVELSEFITVGSSYKTQGDVRNAVWRTLCCNIGIYPGSEAPDEFGE